MVLQLPPKLKDDEHLTSQDLPAVDQFAANDAANPDEAPLVERGTLMPPNPKQLPQMIVNQLSSFLAPEHLAGPLKLIYRPIFFAAIGLHALLLLSGGGKHEEKKEVKDKEKPVTITQISTGKAAPKKLKKVATTELKKTLPKIKNMSAQAPVIKGPPKPEDSKVPEDSKPLDSKTPDKTPDKTPEISQQSKPLPDVSPMPPAGDSIDANNPFADFPHMGSKNDQGEYVVAGQSVSAVGANFSKTLPPLKYTIEPVTESAGRSAYKFEKGGKEAFLNIFQEGANVIYILAGAEVKSLDEWRGIAKIPDDFVALIGGLPTPPGVEDGSVSSTPDESHFANADAFFEGTDQFRPTIGGVSPRRVEGYDPATLYSELIESDLKQIFEVSAVGAYGGGPMWQLKKGKTMIFLNLVPDPSGKSTNIVVWTSQPS
jgi:hypothetical protein